MATEVVRKLIGGVWRTVTSRENGGGGGSQTFETVRKTFAFDTADLVAGIPFHTPTAGDVAAFVAGSTSVAFNGTSPFACIGTVAGLAAAASVAGIGLDSPDVPLGDGTSVSLANALSATSILLGADPLYLALRTGDQTGDPGSTQGEAEIILLIAKAAA